MRSQYVTIDCPETSPQQASRLTSQVSPCLLGGLYIAGKTPNRIELSTGKYAIVDPWNYEWLNLNNWYERKQNHTSYAFRIICLPNPDRPRNLSRDQVSIGIHRQIANPPNGFITDHINHNGLDNRECNLRICTWAQNCAYKKKYYVPGMHSKYKGISHQYGKWQVHCGHEWVGCYDGEIEAAAAYDKAAIEKYGEFALTNF